MATGIQSDGFENQTAAMRDPVKFFRSELKDSKDRYKKWRDRCRTLDLLFRDEARSNDTGDTSQTVNILFSNTVTTLSAVYQRVPRPDVRRRYSETKPLTPEAPEQKQARLARDRLFSTVSMVIERGLNWLNEDYDFDSEFKPVVHDAQLFGRGVGRVRYEAETTGEGESTELAAQSVQHEWVHFDDVEIGPGRSWKDVSWIAFRHRLEADKVRALMQGVENVDAVMASLNFEANAQDDGDVDAEKIDTAIKRCECWEVWDKSTRTVKWLAAGCDQVIAELDDPLGLKDFFPCAKPLFATKSTGTLVPIPPYKIYQDLADELNRITTRVSRIVEAIKVRGLYDSAVEEIPDILTLDDNTLLPVDNTERLKQAGGLEGAIWIMPVEKLITVVRELMSAREAVRQLIYEISGLSDILRGASDPNETAQAQKIKAQFGTMRFDEQKREVQRYARDVMRIKAELLAERFEPAILSMITGVPVDEQMIEIMRSDVMRSFRIDIETDSTIAADEQAEQESVTALLTALIQSITQIMPMVASGDLPKAAAAELIRMAIKPFRGARQIEALLDELPDDEDGGQPQAEQPPDPATMRAQAQIEAINTRSQADMQKMQAELQKMQTEHQMDMERIQAAAEADRAEHQLRMAEIAAKMQAAMQKNIAVAADPSLSAPSDVGDAPNPGSPPLAGNGGVIRPMRAL